MDSAADLGGRLSSGKDSNGKLVRDEDGKPGFQAKYTGLHALQHFFASWCFNRDTDGGLDGQSRAGTVATFLDHGHPHCLRPPLPARR